jgi:hypothetical protein
MIPTGCCRVCGSKNFGCPSLEAATPEPDLWCPLLEEALELRGWRQWAQQYQESEAQQSPGYRRYRTSAAYKRARAAKFKIKAWDHDQSVKP